MRYRTLLLIAGAAIVLVGAASSMASSAPDRHQESDIGIITKPKTEAPHCVDSVQPKVEEGSDIGTIAKPATASPQCVEPSPSEQEASPCPVGMVLVGDATCLDRFEASRPDATGSSMGTDTSKATSRAGVLPWFPVNIATARAACAAAGKRLCKADEMRTACKGPQGTTYAYGNTYAPETCNGIDTYCNCDSERCAGVLPCPYPGCYNRGTDGVVGNGCGASQRVMPTGSFPRCVNEYGAFDLSGNVWELVDRGNDESWYMGGAFNCIDSESLHRCDSLVQNISARGFRCCAEPTPVP